jgi:uncharacterized protein YrrD
VTIDVRLGSSVISSDGKRVGKVDGLVIDPDSKSMLEIIVHQGFVFSTDRVIDVMYIDRIDEDGAVHLTVNADKADQMPPLVTRDYAVASSMRQAPIPATIGRGPTTIDPLMWRSGPAGRGMQSTSEAEYLVAVASAAPVEVRSDLPDESVVIDTGTDVVTVDGEKIGTVDDVLYDENGKLTGFIIKAGRFQHHDMTVPISNVAVITKRYVRLKVDTETVRGT